MKQLKISLITPSLNRKDLIANSLQSAVDQCDEHLEHIVIDGGSTDGTIEIVRQKFPHARLIVQKDRNLYEAINRGILAASGDIIGFLNTDDVLLPGALTEVRAGFDRTPQPDSVCGGCKIHSIGSTRNTSLATFNKTEMKSLRPGDIISGLILINGRFFHRRVFDSLHGFDDDIPTLADREFLARFYFGGFGTLPLSEPIYSYGAHADSLTFSGQIVPRHLAEATELARRRMAEGTSAKKRAFFRRWHGWAAGYESIQALRRRNIRQMLALQREAFSSDFWWPIFFLRQLSWHLATRGERRMTTKRM